MRLLLAVAAVLLVLAAPAAADDVTFAADPDDSIGLNTVRTWSTPAETVAIEPSDGGLRILAGGGYRGGGLDVFVRPPRGKALAPGVYDDVRGPGEGDASHAEFDVTIDSFGGDDDSRFEVLDLERGADGAVKRLWMVFEGDTAFNHGAGHVGEIRIGYGDQVVVPRLLRFPETEAGRPSRAMPVRFTAPRRLTVTGARIAGADADGFALRLDDCTGRELAAGEHCLVWLRHRAAAPGTVRATLQVSAGEATYAAELEAFAWGGTTSADFAGDAGDWIAGGWTGTLGPAAWRFTAATDARALGLTIADGPDTPAWIVLTAAPAGETIAPPHRFDEVAWWGSDPDAALLAVATATRACNFIDRSWFAVDELRTWPNGDVRSAAVRFEQHCDGAEPALRGTLRFRAGDPTQPPPWILTDGTERPAASPAPAPPAPAGPPPPTTSTRPSPTAVAPAPCTGAPFAGRFRARGTTAADRLYGTRRADVLLGGRGRDVIRAGAGADCVDGGPGRDVIDCGPGVDTVYVTRGDRTRRCEHVRRPRPVRSHRAGR